MQVGSLRTWQLQDSGPHPMAEHRFQKCLGSQKRLASLCIPGGAGMVTVHRWEHCAIEFNLAEFVCPHHNLLGKLRYRVGSTLHMPHSGPGETHRCTHDDKYVCISLVECIALVQLFPQDPAHLGPAQCHLFCHDALWWKKGSLTRQENRRVLRSWSP
jgi:hypothetical protein